jgi:hypothetical protein
MQNVRYYRLFSALALLAIALGFSIIGLIAQEDMATIHRTTALIQTHPSQGDVREVEGAHAELFTTEDDVTVIFRTSDLEPGHVYTAWWVVINNPENCADSPCTAADILGNPNSVNSEVAWADGILVTEKGNMMFAAYLAVGEVPGGWFGNGVTNPLGAEVHIVIHDHGLLIPEMAGTMLDSLRGGCTDESVPPPYPDVAKADGEPGPNTCRLVQFVIFQQ